MCPWHMVTPAKGGFGWKLFLQYSSSYVPGSNRVVPVCVCSPYSVRVSSSLSVSLRVLPKGLILSDCCNAVVGRNMYLPMSQRSFIFSYRHGYMMLKIVGQKYFLKLKCSWCSAYVYLPYFCLFVRRSFCLSVSLSEDTWFRSVSMSRWTDLDLSISQR